MDPSGVTFGCRLYFYLHSETLHASDIWLLKWSYLIGLLYTSSVTWCSTMSMKLFWNLQHWRCKHYFIVGLYFFKTFHPKQGDDATKKQRIMEKTIVRRKNNKKQELWIQMPNEFVFWFLQFGVDRKERCWDRALQVRSANRISIDLIVIL